MTKHKFYNEIVAWAMGCQIEEFAYGVWEERDQPKWHLNYQYRIKPQPKEPQYLYVFLNLSGQIFGRKERHAFAYIGEYIGKIKLEVEDA